jgi:hypothetical protein
MRLILVLLAALVLAGAASAATLQPDSHDRMLVQQLAAKVASFKSVAATENDKSDILNRCSAFKNDPAQAFAAAFVLLPALIVDIVNKYKPQLQDVRDTLAAMHPDSMLFEQWLHAESQSFDLLLQFDNHGKKIDYCKAAQVMLSKHATAADIRDVLGLDPALVAKLFGSGAQDASAALKRLNPEMRKFFVAGGLTLRQATALTS